MIYKIVKRIIHGKALYGIIDNDFNEIIPYKYHYIDKIDNLYICYNDDCYKLYNLNICNQVGDIFPNSYVDIQYVNSYIVCQRDDGKFDMIYNSKSCTNEEIFLFEGADSFEMKNINSITYMVARFKDKIQVYRKNLEKFKDITLCYNVLTDAKLKKLNFEDDRESYTTYFDDGTLAYFEGDDLIYSCVNTSVEPNSSSVTKFHNKIIIEDENKAYIYNVKNTAYGSINNDKNLYLNRKIIKFKIMEEYDDFAVVIYFEEKNNIIYCVASEYFFEKEKEIIIHKEKVCYLINGLIKQSKNDLFNEQKSDLDYDKIIHANFYKYTRRKKRIAYKKTN